MSDPFIAEIKIISFNFPPKGWAFCNGQLLQINQNQALFSILGTTYGGDGRVTFALPNLQGRVPLHTGNGFSLGQVGGEIAHMLSISELPAHVHAVNASSSSGDTALPANPNSNAGNILASSLNQSYRPPDQALTTLAPGSIGNAGGSQPHDNMSPYLVLNFVIALTGIFPSQN
jgi:microcystin-dependent protein